MNPPGSNSAVSLGCSCSQAGNNFGVGCTENGRYIFLVDSKCPLHGIIAWERANAGSYSLIKDEDHANGDMTANRLR